MLWLYIQHLGNFRQLLPFLIVDAARLPLSRRHRRRALPLVVASATAEPCPDAVRLLHFAVLAAAAEPYPDAFLARSHCEPPCRSPPLLLSPPLHPAAAASRALLPRPDAAARRALPRRRRLTVLRLPHRRRFAAAARRALPRRRRLAALRLPRRRRFAAATRLRRPPLLVFLDMYACV